MTTDASLVGKATSSTNFVQAFDVAKINFLPLPDIFNGPHGSQCIRMLGSVGRGNGVSRVGDDTEFVFHN
jgi:hypothetical protein